MATNEELNEAQKEMRGRELGDRDGGRYLCIFWRAEC